MPDLWTGARSPRWIYTLLDSEDREMGELTGVEGGQAEIVTLARLGGSATMKMTRQARQAIDFFSDRVRIEYDPGVEGLLPWPVGVYMFSSPRETNNIVRKEEVGLLTKMAVIDEDTLADTYSLDAGTPVIAAVRVNANSILTQFRIRFPEGS